MKLPITDQFLYDLIQPFFHGANNAVDFLLSNKYKKMRILFGNENPIFKKYKQDKNSKQFRQLVHYLKRRNYIKVQNLKGKKAIMLTKQGIDKVLKASFKIDEGRVKRKDGKWVMVSFDIPLTRRKARDLLRSILHNLGYKMFQQSVWVTPYNVAEKTERLLQAYALDQYVKIFLIEEL